MRVLVVDDDRATTHLLQRILAEDGFVVDAADTGKSGREKAEATVYDGMVLELALPDVDGISLIEDLRRSGRDVPVLVLSSTKDEPTTVRALDAGADDYTTKPVDPVEFKARVRALVRRGGPRPSDTLLLGNLRVDRLSHQVFVGGERLSLTRREYSLLEHFLARAGDIVTRAELMEETLEWPAHAGTNLLDVHIARVRKKLATAGAHVSLIVRRRQGFTLSALQRC